MFSPQEFLSRSFPLGLVIVCFSEADSRSFKTQMKKGVILSPMFIARQELLHRHGIWVKGKSLIHSGDHKKHRKDRPTLS